MVVSATGVGKRSLSTKVYETILDPPTHTIHTHPCMFAHQVPAEPAGQHRVWSLSRWCFLTRHASGFESLLEIPFVLHEAPCHHTMYYQRACIEPARYPAAFSYIIFIAPAPPALVQEAVRARKVSHANTWPVSV